MAEAADEATKTVKRRYAAGVRQVGRSVPGRCNSAVEQGVTLGRLRRVPWRAGGGSGRPDRVFAGATAPHSTARRLVEARS